MHRNARLALPLFTLALLPSLARSQSGHYDGYVEIAVMPAAVGSMPVGNLTAINGSTPCSQSFQGKLEVNVGVGGRIGYVFPTTNEALARSMRLRALALSVGYDDLSTHFQSSPAETYDAYDPVNGRFVSTRSEHSAIFTLGYLHTALELELAVTGNLILHAGPSFSLPLSGSSKEEEAILSPSNATFSDRTQTQTIPEGTGTLNDLKPRIGIGGAIAYRMPLGEKLYFQPSMGIDLGITKIQPEWSPLVLRGGIALGYRFVPSPPPPIEPPPVEPIVAVPEAPKEQSPPPFTADVRVDVIADRGPVDFRREIVARYVPILPMIFFDLNASTLPGRYVQLSTAEARAFEERQTPGNAEEAHHQILNIIGARLEENPRLKATLVGTTSRDEEGRAQLGQQRAEAVGRYLQEVWGIDRHRIEAVSRPQPEVPSNSDYAEGREENRRVEIDLSSDEAYNPIQLRVVEPVTEPRQIRFTASAASSLPIRRWQLELTSGTTPIDSIGGTGAPPTTIDWDLTSANREAVLHSGSVNYRLAVYDSLDRSVISDRKAVPVRIDTTVTVTTSTAKPVNTAEFLLITFDFDRASLTRRGREDLKAIAERIGPSSTVSVIGYTDRLGDEAHNRTLAEERARQVAASLPKGAGIDSRGAAPDEAPYASGSPEGRFLSRTVRVIVRNPK
jgi:outer membrane protein OmpA-like peptidoglycan-associated protein